MSHEIFLEVPTADYAGLKHLLASELDCGAAKTVLSDILADGVPSSQLAVDAVRIGIPAIAGLLAMWLGKGKRVRIKRGKASIHLDNIAEDAAKSIISTFLEHDR